MKVHETFGRTIELLDYPHKYDGNKEFIRLTNLCLLLRKDVIYYNECKNNVALKQYAISEIKANKSYNELLNTIPYIDIENCFKTHLKTFRRL